MKVSKLEDRQLDIWVAMAVGRRPSMNWRPSHNFFHAQPFIEAEGIRIDERPGDGFQAYLCKSQEDLAAGRWALEWGPTAATAACRCIVAYRYGSDVPGVFQMFLTLFTRKPSALLYAIKARITGEVKP